MKCTNDFLCMLGLPLQERSRHVVFVLTFIPLEKRRGNKGRLSSGTFTSANCKFFPRAPSRPKLTPDNHRRKWECRRRATTSPVRLTAIRIPNEEATRESKGTIFVHYPLQIWNTWPRSHLHDLNIHTVSGKCDWKTGVFDRRSAYAMGGGIGHGLQSAFQAGGLRMRVSVVVCNVLWN